ncbi:MAG: hypothetical protein ABIB79_00760 [archaeon]
MDYEYIKRYVTKNGELKIRWLEIPQSNMFEVAKFMKEKGTLSSRARGNFGVLEQGVFLNPIVGSSYHYFTSEDYARDYRDKVSVNVSMSHVLKFED